VKTIPKSLEPLAKEARKYKTAEEFENAMKKASKSITKWKEYVDRNYFDVANEYLHDAFRELKTDKVSTMILEKLKNINLRDFYKQATKQGLTRTWNSKTKQWEYKYTKRKKKATKKQPDIKLSQHDKLLLAGEYKIQDKPKEVRNLGKPITSNLKKITKTKPKTKPKKKKRTKSKSKPRSPFDFTIQETLFEGVLK